GANIATNGGSFSASTSTGGTITQLAGTSLVAGAGNVSLNSTSGSITLNGAVSGNSVTASLSGGSFTQGGASTIAVGTFGQLLTRADTIALNGAAGSITGGPNASIVISSANAASTVGIGTAAGTLQLSQAELNTFSGFSSLQIGAFGTGSVAIDGPVS